MLRLLILGLVLLPAAASAQHGTIYYDYAKKLEYALPDAVKELESMAELIEQFPSHSTRRHILDFNASASIMREDASYADSIQAAFAFDVEQFMQDHDPQEMMAIAMAYMQSMDVDMDMDADMGLESMPAQDTYVNFDEGSYAQQRPILDRLFVVTGEIAPLNWKISGAERTFLGHRVLKATAIQDSLEVEVWFTPEIPVPAGPALYGGLPGLILVVEIGDGVEHYTATAIDLELAPAVVRPTEGKEVSTAEFAQIAKEKLKEMQDLMQRIRNTGFDF